MSGGKEIPLALYRWIQSLPRVQALHVWEWLDERPISGPQTIQRELEKRFQR